MTISKEIIPLKRTKPSNRIIMQQKTLKQIWRSLSKRSIISLEILSEPDMKTITHSKRNKIGKRYNTEKQISKG